MLDNNNYSLIDELNESVIDELNELNESLIDELNENSENYIINNTLNNTSNNTSNMSLFNLINNNNIVNKNIILDKVVNTYIQNIQDYNPINWIVKNFNLNNTKNNSILDKYSSDTKLSNMKITFGNTPSSHGVIYNKFFNIESSRYYLLITYVLDSSINLVPYIRDQDKNLIYWITKKTNLIYTKVYDNRHIYIIDIPSDLNFQIYLFNPNPIKGTSLTISQLNINKIDKLSNVDTTI
jgi:hypothetical protein